MSKSLVISSFIYTLSWSQLSEALAIFQNLFANRMRGNSRFEGRSPLHGKARQRQASANGRFRAEVPLR